MQEKLRILNLLGLDPDEMKNITDFPICCSPGETLGNSDLSRLSGDF